MELLPLLDYAASSDCRVPTQLCRWVQSSGRCARARTAPRSLTRANAPTVLEPSPPRGHRRAQERADAYAEEPLAGGPDPQHRTAPGPTELVAHAATNAGASRAHPDRLSRPLKRPPQSPRVTSPAQPPSIGPSQPNGNQRLSEARNGGAQNDASLAADGRAITGDLCVERPEHVCADMACPVTSIW